MSEDMDSQDRTFLQSLKDDIKEIRQENKQSHLKTENHLKKTCTEIKEVRDGQNNMALQLTRIDERLDNHLEASKVKESRRLGKAGYAGIIFGSAGIIFGVISFLNNWS